METTLSIAEHKKILPYPEAVTLLKLFILNGTCPEALSAFTPPEARARSAHTWACPTFSTKVKS